MQRNLQNRAPCFFLPPPYPRNETFQRKNSTKPRPTPTFPPLLPPRLGRWKISSVRWNGTEQLLAPLADKKRSFGRGGGDTRRRKGGWSSGGGGFRGLGWVGQTDPDRVNSECTLCAAASALRKILPSAPACRPETVRHPFPPEVDNAISKYESARGMAKTCVYNTVRGEKGGWRERRGGKVSGVFSLIFILLLLLPFFRLSFFRVLVVNSCGWDFCSFCFFFFFRDDRYGKKGSWGKSLFSFRYYRYWSCVVVVSFGLSDDDCFFLFFLVEFLYNSWTIKEGIAVITLF